MRAALLQMTSGVDPAATARTLVQGIADAAAGGAAMLFTPEMSGLLDSDRDRAAGSLAYEEEDRVLRRCARRLRGTGCGCIWEAWLCCGATAGWPIAAS